MKMILETSLPLLTSPVRVANALRITMTPAPQGRLRVARRFSGGAWWEIASSAVGTIEVPTHTL